MAFKQKGYSAGEGTGSSRKVTRQANKQMKQAKLDTFEGNTNLEKKASMAAAKNRAKTAERKASKVVKKTERKEDRAARVTARGDKRANRKLAKAEKLTGKAGEIKAKSTAKAEKISPTKPKAKVTPKVTPKPKAEVKTARNTGTTYDSAWEKNKDTKAYAKYKGNKAAAVADMKAWNKKNDAKKRAGGGNDATKHSLTKDKGTKGGKPGKGYMG